MVHVVSYYSTQFGELWDRSLSDLVGEAYKGLIRSTPHFDPGKIDAIFFANMMAGILENNLHIPSKIAEILGLQIPIFRVEAACASGGIAFHLAKTYIEAGRGKTVVVLGAEKMTDYSPEETTSALASAASGEEQEAGLTFPGLYAMMANYYLNKYHYKSDCLANVSVKNHYHGTFNSNAHFRRAITKEDVLVSPMIAYPLRMLDCSPISDGAAAILMTSDSELLKKIPYTPTIYSSEVATDSISLSGRKKIDEITSTKIAAQKAFHHAKITPRDINVAELHDCFSIAEILGMEDLGFWQKGKGGKIIEDQPTMLGRGGRLIVNTSGGLKASGHPVGATGVKQIGELYLQLTEKAGKRQVKPVKYGLAHNVGGSGGTAVVTILGNSS